jgi:ERCC4-type nuclease
MLIVDDRERSIIPYLHTEYKVERITIGDYVIVLNGIIVAIIERKTLADLSASLRDGRMENNNKLLEARKKTGCKIIYLIEGNPFSAPSRKYCRVPFKNLQAKLDSLQFKHNMSVVWTKNEVGTADRLATLVRYFDKHIKCFDFPLQTPTTIAGSIAQVKVSHDKPIDLIQIKMLSAIQGLSFAKATLLLRNYTLRQMLTGDFETEDIINTKSAGGMRFGQAGNKIAKRCKDLGDPDKIRVLSAIPRVSKEIAEILLNGVDFADLVQGTVPPGYIAGLCRTTHGKARRLGPSIERSVLYVFEPIP